MGLAGQVLSGVDVGRELAKLLGVFRRAGEPRVGPEAFEALGIPIPRVQRLLDYLMVRNIINLRPPGTAPGRLQFFYAELTPPGRRVVRGEDPLLLR